MSETQRALARLAAQRVEYADESLALPEGSPFDQFAAWYEAAGEALAEPNAMLVATADEHGPDGRIVLLKGYDRDGFVFYTNQLSAKGAQIAADPHVCLVFPWFEMQRQVRVRGIAEKVSAAEADAYFAIRPRGSQLGAVASEQSQPIGSREEFDARFDALEAEWAGRDVERPAHWGGYRVRPWSVEFWQGRTNRMHDRFVVTTKDGAPGDLGDAEAWSHMRLQP